MYIQQLAVRVTHTIVDMYITYKHMKVALDTMAIFVISVSLLCLWCNREDNSKHVGVAKSKVSTIVHTRAYDEKKRLTAKGLCRYIYLY